MSFRVMTYNVLNGGTGRERLLLEVLRVVAPDIVLLQEVFDAGFVGRLADALEMQHFFARGNTKYHLASNGLSPERRNTPAGWSCGLSTWNAFLTACSRASAHV